MILSALISSLTEKILAHVKCITSQDAWVTLEQMSTSHSRARTMQIHYQLATLKKGNLSIVDYFQKFTNLVDTLVAVDQPLSNSELTSFLLAGLGSDYDSLVTFVTTRVDPLTPEDLYGHLLAYEIHLEQNQPLVDLAVAGANFASKNFSHRRECTGRSPSFHHSGRGNYSRNNGSRNCRGRGRGRNYGSSTNTTRLLCQVCNRLGHVAFSCYHRFDNSYQQDDSPNMQAFFAASQAQSDSTWYSDSGATHHLTTNLANLNVGAKYYHGSDQIRMGNGTSLPIEHIGTSHLFTPSKKFIMRNVLHVPLIRKNLISVHRFTLDVNTFVEFHPWFFLVKDQAMGKILLRGRNKNELYHFPAFLSSLKSVLSSQIGRAHV